MNDIIEYKRNLEINVLYIYVYLYEYIVPIFVVSIIIYLRYIVYGFYSIDFIVRHLTNKLLGMSYNKYDISFCHQWVRFDKMVKYINMIRLKEFSVKKNRDEFRNYLTCDVQYIVDMNVRFPIDFNMYFNLNEGLFSVLYMRLLSILDNQDRKYNEASTSSSEKHMDDAKVAWYHTLTDVYTMIHSLKGPDSILGVYDRGLYECDKTLIWNNEKVDFKVDLSKLAKP